jgi:hypothetical protein
MSLLHGRGSPKLVWQTKKRIKGLNAFGPISHLSITFWLPLFWAPENFVVDGKSVRTNSINGRKSSKEAESGAQKSSDGISEESKGAIAWVHSMGAYEANGVGILCVFVVSFWGFGGKYLAILRNLQV